MFELPDSITTTVQGRLKRDVLAETAFFTDMVDLYTTVYRHFAWEMHQPTFNLNQVKRKFLKKYKIPGRFFNSVNSHYKGDVASRKECLKLEVKTHKATLASIFEQIRKLPYKKNRTPEQKAAILHQKKRKQAYTRHKLARAKERIPVAYRYVSHSTGCFKLIGSKDESNGNQLCQLKHVSGNEFIITLTVPDALQKYGKHVSFPLRLPHKSELLLPKLKQGTKAPMPAALSYTFIPDRLGVKVLISCQEPLPERQVSLQQGAIGIDVNDGFIALAEVNHEGNPIHSKSIPWITYGKNKAEATEASFKVAHQVRDHALKTGKPVVIEALDFQNKKSEMYSGIKRKKNRRLSSFAYNKILYAIERTCQKAGIPVAKVNPAYTSLIGSATYHRCHSNLSTHEATAAVIARRALGLKERLPRKEPLRFFYKHKMVTLKGLSCKDSSLRHVAYCWHNLFAAILGELKNMHKTGSDTAQARQPLQVALAVPLPSG